MHWIISNLNLNDNVKLFLAMRLSISLNINKQNSNWVAMQVYQYINRAATVDQSFPNTARMYKWQATFPEFLN